MRFGTLDTFFGMSAPDLRLGRNVANHEFLKALLKFGTFDAYHFFLPDVAHVEVFQRRLQTLLPQPLLKRVHTTLQVALRETVQELPFTVFHQSDFTRALPYLASFRARHAKQPFPVTGVTHSLNTSLMPLRYLQLGLAPLRPFDAIVCTSEAGREVVRRSFAQLSSRLQAQWGLSLQLQATLAHIPLGIDDERFQLTDRLKARAALGLPRDGQLLLYLGRLSARTKLDLHPMLYALSRAWSKGQLKSLKLVLAGGAEEQELAQLKRLVASLNLSQRVLFQVDFDDARKMQLFSACELFVSPSDNLQETFGLSVVEAMAAGCVPLVSQFDGYRELVLDGQTGLHLPTFWGPPLDALQDLEGLNPAVHPFYLSQTFGVDLEALVAGLERLLSQPAERERLSQAARAHAEQFRWSRIIPRYEALWRQLSAEAQRAAVQPKDHLPSPLNMDSYDIFGHYPTLKLAGEVRLSLTEAGRETVQGAPLPVPHRDMGPLLHTSLLQPLLEHLSHGEQTLTTLEQWGLTLEAPPDLLRHHVLWAAKYGLLRLRPGECT